MRAHTPNRRASWGDEHDGEALTEVHDVWDTHYRRTWWMRHRHQVIVLGLVTIVVSAVSALIASVF